MVVNFVVIVSDEEDGNNFVGVTEVHAFPALSPAKKWADRKKNERDPYDIVVWDVNTSEAVYSPFNKEVDAQPQG